MKKKSLREWVREHRAEIDQVINAVTYRYDGKGGKGTVPDPSPRHNDSEREEWVKNDEGLYNLARSEQANV
jgi:hypothetical protein